MTLRAHHPASKELHTTAAALVVSVLLGASYYVALNVGHLLATGAGALAASFVGF